MLKTRTPLRISFAGGGSDLKEYWEKFGGAVVSTSIDKYIFISVNSNFNNEYFIKYSITENVKSINEIEHPIIKEVFKKYSMPYVNFNSTADVPSGTGLGSSSAFCAGLINLCGKYKNEELTKEEIANLACKIEIDELQEPIGKQDQFACSVGGLNYIEFNQDGSVNIESLNIKTETIETLQDNLMLFYTGKTHKASDILKLQTQNIKTDKSKTENLHKMVQLAKDLRKEILNENIDVMGEILNSNWNYKKELAKVISNTEIDDIYNIAIKNGAKGGKLLGAGSGGFLLFYVEKELQDNVRKSLSNLKELKFKFENTGTTVVY